MQRILVSGGTSTLGQAICRLAVSQGSLVYFGYATSEEKVKDLHKELVSYLITLHLDLRNDNRIK